MSKYECKSTVDQVHDRYEQEYNNQSINTGIGRAIDIHVVTNGNYFNIQ